jgi:hypothetical protein
MSSKLYYPPSQNALQKQLNADLTTGVTASATLTNTSGLQNKAGVMVVNRINTSGTLLPAAGREYIAYSGTSGSTVTTLTRGLGGSSDQAHSTGEVVEFVFDVVQMEAVVSDLANLVDPATGLLDVTKVVDLSTSQTLTTKTLTTPVITKFSGNAQFPQVYGEYDNGNSSTAKQIDWAKGDRQKLTITGDACAITFTGAIAGQTLTLRLVEDGSGHTAHTWPTLKWPLGSAGTPTLTASAINLYIFYYDGTNYLAQLAAGFA